MERKAKSDYLSEVKKRKKASRIHHRFQATGLALAEILEDARHKSLYIKLAKKYDNDKMIILAKNIAEKKNVLKKGAYFMKLLKTPE